MSLHVRSAADHVVGSSAVSVKSATVFLYSVDAWEYIYVCIFDPYMIFGYKNS